MKFLEILEILEEVRFFSKNFEGSGFSRKITRGPVFLENLRGVRFFSGVQGPVFLRVRVRVRDRFIQDADCKTQNGIYAARCKKHDVIYIGHTGEKLSSQFSKHRYDLKSRPDNNELTKHLNSSDHDFEKDIDITILKSDIPTVNQREFFEDKFICKLGTLSPNGLNADTHQYAKDMYSSYRNLLH